MLGVSKMVQLLAGEKRSDEFLNVFILSVSACK